MAKESRVKSATQDFFCSFAALASSVQHQSLPPGRLLNF